MEAKKGGISTTTIRLRHHKVPVHHGDFFACYERSDSNTPFQADRIETDVAQGWVANAPAPVHGEAAGSTALAPSVAEAAGTARDDGSPTFEQTGMCVLGSKF